jgi:hypothetical protein
MNKSRVIKLFSLLLLFSFTAISCGDDPVSAKKDPPTFPEFSNIQPDLSYFENNNPQKAATYTNFYAGASYALGLSAISSFGTIYAGYFTGADNEDATYKDGQWVWEYQYGYERAMVKVVLTAKDTGSFTEWAMNWSFDDGQGESFEDYTMIEGKTANDGTSGSWTFNAQAPENSSAEVPFLKSDWTRESDTKMTITTKMYNDAGGVDVVYTFSQDANDFSASVEDNDGKIIVVWNTDTMTGYYQNKVGERFCWDENFQDVACAS